MKLINAYLLALTLCFAGVATADHKTGHPPPTEGGSDLSDLSCAEGQTIAVIDGAWVCANFPAGDGVGLDCAEGQTIALVDGAWVCADFPTGAALTGLERVVAHFDESLDNENLSTISTQQVIAYCPGTKRVVGGGYMHFFGGTTGVIRDSIPTVSPFEGWLVAGQNAPPWRLSAVAMCADAEPEPVPE